GIARHLECLMTAADLGFASRKRDVESSNLVDREAFPDGVDGPDLLQNRLQRLRLNAEHFDIDVFRWMAHEAVADPPADDEGAPAMRPHEPRDADSLGERFVWSTHVVAPRTTRKP